MSIPGMEGPVWNHFVHRTPVKSTATPPPASIVSPPPAACNDGASIVEASNLPSSNKIKAFQDKFVTDSANAAAASAESAAPRLQRSNTVGMRPKTVRVVV